MAGSSPAITIFLTPSPSRRFPTATLRRSGTTDQANGSLSVQRLDLDDRGAVIAADPQHRPGAAIVDEDPPDIGRSRQLIFDDVIGLGIEPRDPVIQHRAGPDLAV